MSKIRPVLPYLLCLLLAALILDLGNPLFDVPARDGGFFLYAGSQILGGKIPYVDFWDSKGPAIFYINALGLWLGQGSRWGVWGLEFAFAFAWLAILYKTVSQSFRLTVSGNPGAGGLQTLPASSAAVFGIVLAALGLRIVLGYGNYTEEYALLFNALALYLFFADGNNGWKYFWIGLLFGISFSFRANNIGGLFGVLIALFIFNFLNRKIFDAVKTVSVLLAGFAIPLLLWALYFQSLGAAWDMIYASIVFNFSYASAKGREMLDIFGGFGKFGMSWAAWMAALGYLVYGYGVIRKLLQPPGAGYSISLFDLSLLAWFPIEILLSNLSGRNFSHYYISWALAVAVYGAALYASFAPYLLQYQLIQRIGQFAFLVLVIGLPFAFPASLIRYGETISNLLSRKGLEYSDPLAAYIQASTRQDELILTWYPETTLNFLAGRASPVKYVYYPLFLEGTLPAGAEENYIEGLTSRRPGMIVDCSRAVDAIPSLDPAAREDQFSKPGVKKKMYIQPGMEVIFSFVTENYQLETSMEGCLIFRLKVD